MQRWEQFNKICNSNDSLQAQIDGIVAEKVKETPDIDLTTLIPCVTNWLKEEVSFKRE